MPKGLYTPVEEHTLKLKCHEARFEAILAMLDRVNKNTDPVQFEKLPDELAARVGLIKAHDSVLKGAK